MEVEATKVVPNVCDRVVGFEFKDEECEVSWGISMEEYVGKTGTVSRVDHNDDTFSIEFDDGEIWWYPIRLAHLAYEKSQAQTKDKGGDELPNIYGLKIDIEDTRMSRKKLQEQMKELDEKEAALTQQLKEYGFALVEDVSDEQYYRSLARYVHNSFIV